MSLTAAVEAPSGSAWVGRPQRPVARGLLVEPGSYNCSNVGDVAMLQVAVKRLRALWPAAHIGVFTGDRAALLSHCPDVRPLGNKGRTMWVEDRYLFGGLHRWSPAVFSEWLVRLRRKARRRTPRLTATALRWRACLRGDSPEALDAFVDRWRETDLVCIAGQASLVDHAPEHAGTILATLEAATEAGVPTAMMGQGIGPMHDRELRARARQVFPSVGLVAVREGRSGPQLLAELGVDPARVVVTGDDAIELAVAARRSDLGDALGVNLRVTAYAGFDSGDLVRLRPVLHDFARFQRVPLLPVPIALRGVAQDPRHLRELLQGYDDESNGGEELTTPARVIAQVARCRVVVTGAYHAAVFALALGVPAICLARSPYYVDKFRGLADLFGPGCFVILPDQGDPAARLSAALHEAWEQADELCTPLRLAADRQCASGREAYARLARLIRTNP